MRDDVAYYWAPESPTVSAIRLFRVSAKGGAPGIVHPLAPAGAALAAGPDTLYLLTEGVLWQVRPR